MAAKGEQCSRGDIYGISTKSDSLYYIGAVSYTASNDKRYSVSYTLIPQTRINACQCQFDRYAHVIADPCGSRACSSAEAVDGYDVGTAPGYTACDGGDIVDCGNLDYDRLFILCRFLERVYELPQILY
jgi:hypothetical protein